MPDTDPPQSNGFLLAGPLLRWDAASVDNRSPVSQVVALCPSCGLYTADMHGSEEDCIRALEDEVRRLSAILEQFKKAPPA